MRKRLSCAALSLCLLLSGCGTVGELRAPVKPSASPVAELTRIGEPKGCTALPVYLDGMLLTRGYQKKDARYIELRPLCDWAGIDMDWSGDEKSFRLDLNGLRVEGNASRSYFTASGRYLYAPEGWLLRGTELCLPEWVVCKLLNLSSKEEDGALRLDGSKLRLLEGGEDYYDLNVPYGDFYWLSHIIGSEAGIEPMEGKIGVGNVVYNRIANEEFPNTVYEVVFDHSYSVQFEPVSKGTIHEEPKPEDIIAAYLVMEGANTAGDCIFFVNPDFGSFWFDNNLDFVMKLGRHNFYVKKGSQNAGTSAGTDPEPGT